MKSNTLIHRIVLSVLLGLFSIHIPFALAEEETQESAPTENSENSPETEEGTEGSAEGNEEAAPKISLTAKEWLELKRPKSQAESSRIKLLLTEIDERELLKLNTSEEEFIGLFSEQNTAQPLGGILILHDSGLHPNEQSFIAPLRKRLPDYGWNTLAIAIPDAETTPLPDRKWPSYPADFTLNPTTEELESGPEDEDSEQATEGEDTATKETPEETTEETNKTQEASSETKTGEDSAEQETAAPGQTPQERTMARIEAAVQELKNRGQLNLVIIGQGVGASWAISYLDSSSSQEMFTLVVVDPELPPVENDKNYINDRLAKFVEIPILDIVSDASAYAKQQAKERKNTAQRKLLTAYQQLSTRATLDSDVHHHRIVKRIRGWLAQNAPGEEQPIQ
ncbi:DUF3530 family protein [Litoribacillus peritrichatus]|uniref:Alpha/beta hydrolase family protein n=1 Tax=Litoribacillus peritrichatus TaxID=718191 RepID=A0ABP7LYR0_9GAMM